MSKAGEITEAVRHQIRSHFAAHGASANEPVRESLLIRGGFFCGRRFECHGLQAVWFVEEGQVKLFGPDGRLLVVEAAATVRAEPPQIAAA